MSTEPGRGWSSVARLVTGAPVADSSGVRGLLRHHLALATAAIVACTLLGAALLGLGNPTWFAVLSLVAAGGIALDLLFTRPASRLPQELGFQLVLASWPVAFILLGAAGWRGGEYHGEAVALVALLVSGLVALVQPLHFAVAWALLATMAVGAGAALGGQLTAETAIAAGAVPVGAAFGNRLRHVIEEYLGTRRRLLHEVTGVRASDDPFATAAALIEPVMRSTPLTAASITWFTDDGRAVLLAIRGRNVSPYLTPGAALPKARGELLRRQAESGPWITGWTVTEGDGGYSSSVAAMGIEAVAYMPITHENRIIGLLGAGVNRAEGGQATMAEQIPMLAEVADVAAAALGPSIARLEVRSSAVQLIDDILAQRRYWPVFQPVRDLATDAIVGYEALSRFDAGLSTHRLFAQAGLLGRQRDLEIATMRAAVKAAASLPGSSWVSVNCSAVLLVDTDTVGPILGTLERPVVIELSEHEVVTDYEPIAAAMTRLAPHCTLAVDDAGAGFASLRHVLEVRPSYVKLDLGLVQGVATDLTRRALVAGFVHFAHDARFTLIAEGIEDEADLRMLKKLGVTLGQGYLLGRPERVSDLAHGAATRRSPRPRRQRARSA